MAPNSFENHTFSLNSAFFQTTTPQNHEFLVELPMQDGIKLKSVTYQRRHRGPNSKQRNPWDQPVINFDTATLDAREINGTSRANVFQLPPPQTPSNLPLAASVELVEVWDQDGEIQDLGWGAHWHDRSSFRYAPVFLFFNQMTLTSIHLYISLFKQ